MLCQQSIKVNYFDIITHNYRHTNYDIFPNVKLTKMRKSVLAILKQSSLALWYTSSIQRDSCYELILESSLGISELLNRCSR